MEYLDFLIGWFLGIISLIIAEIIGYYFTKRSMKTEHEHSERILRMQLYQDDRKKALIELDELLKKRYSTFQDLQRSVESFLDGSSGIFLPDKLKEELRKEIQNVNTFLSEKLEEIYGPEPEPPDDYEDWVQALSPEEAVEEEIETRLKGFKSEMRQKIRKYVSEGL